MLFLSTHISTHRLTLFTLMIVCSSLCVAIPARGDTLRWFPKSARQQEREIVVYANRITRSTDGGGSVFLLEGKVWIGQGTVNIWCDKGIIETTKVPAPRSGGHYRMRVHAEGKVVAESGGKKVSSLTAHVELWTRGRIKLRAADKKIHQRTLGANATYQRARTEFAVNQRALPGKLQQVQNPTEPAKLPDKGIKMAVNLQPPIRISRAENNSIRLAGGTQKQTPPEKLPAPQAVKPPHTTRQPGLPPLFGGKNSAERTYFIRPRSSILGIQARNFPLPGGETAVVVSSGVILTITNADGKGGLLDIEADQLVFWTKGTPKQILEDMQGNRSKKERPMEFFMAGNVEIRTKLGNENRLLRADEVYYDVNRQAALATKADLEIDDPRLRNPVHVRAREIHQLNQNLYRALDTKVNASALPWDPGLFLTVREATVETKPITRTTIFGRPIVDRRTGLPVQDTQRYFKGSSMFAYLEGVPFFYLPYVQGDVDDPLGPLENIAFNYNDIFGFQLFTTWDMYNLIGVTAMPGTRWRLNLDVLSKRGPAIGSDFTFGGEQLFGIPNRYRGVVKAYVIYDTGDDVLGGDRGNFAFVAPGVSAPVDHPNGRGRFLFRNNIQDLPNGFSTQMQLSALSDKNFHEQYYYQEFYNGLDQETFLYLKQQQDDWAWSALVRPRLNHWFTRTEWYPRLDGYLLGASIFDLITYNAKASAGYAELETAGEPPFAFAATDVATNTGRFDLWQEVALPLPLQFPVKFVPYGILDLTYYTNDLTGEDRGRLFGAGGLRTALPLSRLYPNVDNDLFNLKGIFHKVTLTGNYYMAHSDTSFRQLPQLDRLNDDASDQALRDIRPFQPLLNPANATFLTNSPLFDPQLYALRRLVADRIDTRDDMHVLQLAVQQRWQTKRGFPGRRHIIDWMTLNLSASIFPTSDRDNFGEAVGFLEYDWVWNIGDRTSLVSTGWVDPIDNGPRVFTLGANLNRPDQTSLYVGYRHIDPLKSKSVIGAVAYRFSEKYSVTFSGSYDFGVDNQVTSVVLSRDGTDLRVSFGLTYNSILNNFGVVFEIFPNLFPTNVRSPGTPGSFVSATGVGR